MQDDAGNCATVLRSNSAVNVGPGSNANELHESRHVMLCHAPRSFWQNVAKQSHRQNIRAKCPKNQGSSVP